MVRSVRMKKFMKRRYHKESNGQKTHQNSPSEFRHINNHLIGLLPFDSPFHSSPPSFFPPFDPKAMHPQSSRDLPTDFSGKHHFRPTGECTSNLQQDPIPVLAEENIPPSHHESSPPSLYIPSPFPDFIRNTLHFQSQSGRVGRPECCNVVHHRESNQSILIPLRFLSSDLLYSNKQGKKQSYLDQQAIQAVLRYNSSFHSTLCLLTSFFSVMAENRQQPAAQEGAEPQGNPLDRVLGNDTCTLCKEHCFLIARFVKHHNALKEDFQADSRSKRKKLEKQKKEIEDLKEKCQHLEEAISHIKNLTESMQVEASTKASQRDQQKDDQMEDTINQFWC